MGSVHVIDTCADVKISYCGTPSPFGTFWGVLYNGCPFTDARSVSSYDSTACSDGNFTICFPDLDAGTYYYGVAQFLGSTGPYVLNVSAAVCGSDLATNDECVNAIPIPGQADCQTSFFTNPCATQSLPAVTCGTLAGDASDDVWYSFVATAADMTIGASPRGNMDIVLELFSGSCGSSTSIGCADVSGSGAPEDLIASNLTVGTTYYFRIYDFRFQYASAEPGYDLCVVEGLGSGVGMEEGVVMSTSSSIYPNPNNGDFTVSVDPRSAYGSISIIDATGRIVLARNERNTTGTVQLLAAGKLSPGVYTVRVGAGSRTSEGRLMIQ
ncbi:MAG: T9SS type A sorting domain-containing protein [Flavobacteriales bacterium]|nr:T9SS type A sorting domain-containing protein [Flavobacteriales bacterium]